MSETSLGRSRRAANGRELVLQACCAPWLYVGGLEGRLVRLAVILGIGDVGAPTGGGLVSVAGAFGDGQVGHEVVGRGTVPVLLVGGRVDDVASPDRYYGTASGLRPNGQPNRCRRG